jgi:7-carboxy-7-deazaguanine synthase
MTIDEILAAIQPHECNLVEITGGEPLLQEEVSELSSQLLHRGHTVLIETGGALDIRILPAEVIKILDIKCPESGMTEHMKWENLHYLAPKDEIKFVINSRKDYDWAVDVMNRYQLHQKNLILFSPVYQKMPADQLAEWILRDKLPVRFQIQLHKALWGETPGR